MQADIHQDPEAEVPFACDLSVFTAEQREHLGQLSVELFGAVSDVRELADGYAFRLPASFSVHKVADFIANDHLCCPFLNHGMDLEPKGGSLWLRLTAPREGVKEFVIGEIGGNNLLSDEVAIAAGFKQPEA